MIPINKFIEDTTKKIKTLKKYEYLDLRPYKRDRSVIIEKNNNNFNLYENGFIIKEYINISKSDIEKLLREIRKREFPRSNIFRSDIIKKKWNS